MSSKAHKLITFLYFFSSSLISLPVCSGSPVKSSNALGAAGLDKKNLIPRDDNDTPCPDSDSRDWNGCFCPDPSIVMCNVTNPYWGGDNPCKNANKRTATSSSTSPEDNISESFNSTFEIEKRQGGGIDYPYRIIWDPSPYAEKIVQALNGDTPLQSVLYAVSWQVVEDSATKLITNRLPSTERNKYVTGLAGKVLGKVVVKLSKNVVRTFLNNTIWEIRWDVDNGQYAKQQPDGSWVKGLHVNLHMEGDAVGGGKEFLDAAFVPKQATTFQKTPLDNFKGACPANSQQNTYWQIIDTITSKADYSNVLSLSSAIDPVDPPIASSGGAYTFRPEAGGLDAAAKYAGYPNGGKDLVQLVVKWWDSIYNPND